MNANTDIEEPRSLNHFAEEGRQKFLALRTRAEEALPAARDYARSHPWMIAAAGAAALGGVVLAALQSRREPSRSEIVRSWLDDARSRLPRQKQSFLDRILGRRRSLFS